MNGDSRAVQKTYTQVFAVTHLNGHIADTRRHRPTPEMQDGGRQTGSICNSCCVTDRIEVKMRPHLLIMRTRPHE